MKVKSSPGVYVPYDSVCDRIRDKEAFGARDLVDLGLFHSEHFVRDAINSKKLNATKINKKSTVICRNELLNYWKDHRNKDYQPANNALLVHLAADEVDTVGRMIELGKRYNNSFSKDDFFRNLIQHLEENRATIIQHKQFFKLN